MNIVASVLVALRADEIMRNSARIMVPYADISSQRLPMWWRWTAYLAVAITARRIAGAMR